LVPKEKVEVRKGAGVCVGWATVCAAVLLAGILQGAVCVLLPGQVRLAMCSTDCTVHVWVCS